MRNVVPNQIIMPPVLPGFGAYNCARDMCKVEFGDRTAHGHSFNAHGAFRSQAVHPRGDVYCFFICGPRNGRASFTLVHGNAAVTTETRLTAIRPPPRD